MTLKSEQFTYNRGFSLWNFPWRKYRIEIHSDSIKTIPIHSNICIRANANHSEPIQKSVVSRLMKNGQKPIRLNPINSETSIRMNPNQSETKLSIQINSINPRSEWFELILIENSVWINPSSDWFGLIWIENLVSDWCLGINRIRSDWFFTVFY